VVLISGAGSNLQAIIDRCADGFISAQVTAVISNQADAYGLARAREAGIPAHCLDHRDFRRRVDFDAAMIDLVDSFSPDLIVLAGFMRILGQDFVERYLGIMLNIHPSLLPLYPGLDTHQRALADGVKNHGASVHFVTAELDGGPILIQGHVPVEPHDTPETLAQRVHTVEHQIYPQAIAWFAKGRLRLSNGRAMLDGMPVLVPDNIQEAFVSLSTEPEQ
jgi:phosphoribosylglycinamide formyltransferase-1